MTILVNQEIKQRRRNMSNKILRVHSSFLFKVILILFIYIKIIFYIYIYISIKRISMVVVTLRWLHVTAYLDNIIHQLGSYIFEYLIYVFEFFKKRKRAINI